LWEITISGPQGVVLHGEHFLIELYNRYVVEFVRHNSKQASGVVNVDQDPLCALRRLAGVALHTTYKMEYQHKDK